MAMQKKYDAVFSGEKYTTREGEEKTRFVNIGAVFERDDGSLCMKLESIPVGFTGWVNFYEPREREQQPQQGGGQRQQPRAGQYSDAKAGSGRSFDEDEIPF